MTFGHGRACHRAMTTQADKQPKKKGDGNKQNKKHTDYETPYVGRNAWTLEKSPRIDEIRVSAHPKGHGVLRGGRKKPSGVRGCNKSRLPLFRMIAKEASERACLPAALMTVLCCCSK